MAPRYEAAWKLVPNGKTDLRSLYAEAETVEEALRTFALSPITLSQHSASRVEKGTASHPKRIHAPQ
jgi:hypothetical protein